MSRSVPTAWVRIAALALIGALGVLIDVRPARAGCHVAEKPTFGLSHAEAILPGLGGLASVDRPPARVAPKPCSGDVPGDLGRLQPLGLAAIAERGPVAPAAPVARLRPRRIAARPILFADRLDRPPRAAGHVA